MNKRSSIAVFIAATSALAISAVDNNTVKAGEKDLRNLKMITVFLKMQLRTVLNILN